MSRILRKIRLRWEPHAGGAWGYSGQLVVAMVGERDGGVFYYHLSAVQTKGITKGSGECCTLARAKAAAERGWSAWCAEAGLAPVSEP